MKRFLVNVTIVAILAFIVQWALIRYVPNIVYKIAVHRSGVNNKWVNAGKTDAHMRKVVMPNPDFVYSALFYDVSDRDIVVRGVLPDSTYASVSFYDDRCQPYYVYNNLVPGHTGAFHLTLSQKDLAGSNDVKAKTTKGVIICRFLVKGDSTYHLMKEHQSQLMCEVK